MSMLAVVFAKPPRPGAAKTRLAAEVGPDAAAKVAGALLADTVDALARTGWSVVLSTPEPDADHGVDVPRWDQGAGDLGARLERSLRRALAVHDRAVALGGDAPGWDPADLDAIATARDDATLAPTDDGGFWALGLSRCPAGLFDGIRWSAPTTADETRAALARAGLSTGWGPRWFDVDTAADLRRWRAVVAPSAAPRTHAALDALGWDR